MGMLTLVAVARRAQARMRRSVYGAVIGSKLIEALQIRWFLVSTVHMRKL